MTAFDPGRYQVLVVNNGNLSWEERDRAMLGLLHQAVIPVARPERSRWINSSMMTTAGPGEPGGLSREELERFIDTGAAASA